MVRFDSAATMDGWLERGIKMDGNKNVRKVFVETKFVRRFVPYRWGESCIRYN